MNPRVEDFEQLRDQYLETQLAGNGRAALALIEASLDRGVEPAALRQRVVGAAQQEIGRLWEQDRISVAQEHAATAISQLVLAHLFHRMGAGHRSGRQVLLACVPGELHDFPARLFADALDAAGHDVCFLGADVPQDALIAEVERRKPDLLALSVTMRFNIVSLASTLRAVRRRWPSLPVAVGGLAVDRDSCEWGEHDLPFAGGDAAEFVAAVDARLAVSA